MATPRLTFVRKRSGHRHSRELKQNQVGTNRKLIGREFSKSCRSANLFRLIREMPMPKIRQGGLTGSLGDQSCEPPFWFHRLLAAFNAAA